MCLMRLCGSRVRITTGRITCTVSANYCIVDVMYYAGLSSHTYKNSYFLVAHCHAKRSSAVSIIACRRHFRHPDKNRASNAKAKFIEVQEAYDVLSDGEARDRFDRFGTADPEQAAYEGYGDYEEFFAGPFGARYGWPPNPGAQLGSQPRLLERVV